MGRYWQNPKKRTRGFAIYVKCVMFRSWASVSGCSSKFGALLITILMISGSCVQKFGQTVAKRNETNEGFRKLRKMRHVWILGFCIRLFIKIWSASYQDFDDKRELRKRLAKHWQKAMKRTSEGEIHLKCVMFGS